MKVKVCSYLEASYLDLVSSLLAKFSYLVPHPILEWNNWDVLLPSTYHLKETLQIRLESCVWSRTALGERLILRAILRQRHFFFLLLKLRIIKLKWKCCFWNCLRWEYIRYIRWVFSKFHFSLLRLWITPLIWLCVLLLACILSTHLHVELPPV